MNVIYLIFLLLSLVIFAISCGSGCGEAMSGGGPCPEGSYQARCMNMKTGEPICIPYGAPAEERCSVR